MLRSAFLVWFYPEAMDNVSRLFLFPLSHIYLLSRLTPKCLVTFLKHRQITCTLHLSPSVSLKTYCESCLPTVSTHYLWWKHSKLEGEYFVGL